MRVEVITIAGTFIQELDKDTPIEMLNWIRDYFGNWKSIEQGIHVEQADRTIILNPDQVVGVVIIDR